MISPDSRDIDQAKFVQSRRTPVAETVVWVMLRKQYDDTEIVDVFVSREAAEERIVGWVRSGKTNELSGIVLESYNVKSK